MSSDASAAAASPMTNGSEPQVNREADASTTTTNQTLAEACADLHARVSNFLNAEPESDVVRRTQEQTKTSMGVIEKALQDYEYVLDYPTYLQHDIYTAMLIAPSFDQLSLSYNGGKDCLVLLILYLAVLHTHFTQPSSRRKDGDSTTFPTSIPSIYAEAPDPFPSVTSFVETSTRQYHLDLIHISTNPGTKPTPSKAKSHSSPPTSPEKENAPQVSANEETKIVTFRDAFAQYLDSHKSVKAIFVGTRRTDPHGGKLTHFDMTDGAWPRFMRIHPVIDWHLSEIWAFLRSPYLAGPEDREAGREHLEYCAMYDEGYTSLGGVGDTLRNPKLRIVDESGKEKFRPAWMCTEDAEERMGRE